jgi:tetratricopeptide (TPR) repeat protein
MTDTTTAADPIEAIVAKDAWNYDDCLALVRELFTRSDAVNKFRTILAGLEGANPQPAGAVALKIGIARYMLCRFKEALEALSQATDNKDTRYFQALCQKSLTRYQKAIEDFQRAQARGWDDKDAAIRIAECQALSGKLEAAEAALKPLESKMASNADFHYAAGWCWSCAGSATGRRRPSRRPASSSPATPRRLSAWPSTATCMGRSTRRPSCTRNAWPSRRSSPTP